MGFAPSRDLFYFGGLHLKGFCRDVFLMTRGAQTKASYHEFEKQFTDVKSP